MAPKEAIRRLRQPHGLEARVVRPNFLGVAGDIPAARRSPRWQQLESVGIAIGLGCPHRVYLSTNRPQVSAWLPGRMPRCLSLTAQATRTHKAIRAAT